MVMTPWFEQAIPFQEAAELGTNKVFRACYHRAVLTTDGSITDIPREDYGTGRAGDTGTVRAWEAFW